MCKTPPSVSLVEGEVKQHRAAIKGERRREEGEGGSAAQLLDKDWSAIPEYIHSGCLCLIVFIMGITMRGTLCTATKIPFMYSFSQFPRSCVCERFFTKLSYTVYVVYTLVLLRWHYK
jgi:hypothetical protein